MAVSPKQADGLHEEEIERIREVEAEIDKQLNAKFTNGLCTPVRCSVSGDLKSKVIREIETKYQEAGWHIQFTRDKGAPVFLIGTRPIMLTGQILDWRPYF